MATSYNGPSTTSDARNIPSLLSSLSASLPIGDSRHENARGSYPSILDSSSLELRLLSASHRPTADSERLVLILCTYFMSTCLSVDSRRRSLFPVCVSILTTICPSLDSNARRVTVSVRGEDVRCLGFLMLAITPAPSPTMHANGSFARS